ncbi:hypothetical protein ACWGLG_16220 [Streptomyces antimycoticus]
MVLTLASTYDLDDQDRDREEAWHILLAMHSMLGQEAFDQFVDCAISALEPEPKVVGA